jgi:hypothetical protein
MDIYFTEIKHNQIFIIIIIMQTFTILYLKESKFVG